MRPGQVERRTHDYKRHGTTSLFAALDVKAGTIIGKCMSRHRAQEFRRFLDTVEQKVPVDLDIHIIMDNASSHKTKLIRHWFAKRPRWHRHFTPTSASWINQVERFFALLTEQQIKRGAHRFTKALEATIEAYIDARKRRSQAFPLDQVSRRYHRLHRSLLPTNSRRAGSMCIGTSESGH
jgi:transposase